MISFTFISWHNIIQASALFALCLYTTEAEDKAEVTMTVAIMISKVIITDTDQIVETEDSIDRTEVGLGMNKIIGEVISEIM